MKTIFLSSLLALLCGCGGSSEEPRKVSCGTPACIQQVLNDAEPK